MPLARIISRVREDADELANDLRGRGFEIEIVAPDNIPAHPVDLEVTLEECATEDALASVENTPQPQDVSVFIAPGALVETARPMVVVPLLSEPVVGPTVAELSPVAEEVTVMAKSDPSEELVASHATERVATASGIELPVAERAQPVPEEDSQVVLVEGETIPGPVFETLPSAAALPVGEKFPRRLRIRIKYSDKVFWRIALATSILAVGGLLTLSAHRQSPLRLAAESATPPVQMAAPFAGAKIKEASLPTNQAPVSQAPANVSEAKPSPAPQPVAVRPRNHAMQRTVAFRPKSSKRNPESDFVAPDTVVHFGKQAATSPPQVAKKPSIRHYTDLK